MKVRIWRSDMESAYADVEVESVEAAEKLIEDGDDELTWTSTRYTAEYDYEEVKVDEPAPRS